MVTTLYRYYKYYIYGQTSYCCYCSLKTKFIESVFIFISLYYKPNNRSDSTGRTGRSCSFILKALTTIKTQRYTIGEEIKEIRRVKKDPE